MPIDQSTIDDNQAVAAAPRPVRRFALPLLFAGALCTGMGQTIVFSVLPPLARELALKDYQVLFVFMISAIGWVSMGPRWGRVSDEVGRKPLILLGLGGFAISMILFGASIQLGVVGALSGLPLYIMMVLTRSIYGIIGSAGPPAAQAYIADRTAVADRTRGMAGFSAAFGLGAMIGPAFGAGATFFGKTAPFFGIAIVAVLMSLAVFAFLPENAPPQKRAVKAPLKRTDKRLRAFALFALCFGIINAIPIQTIGFYFIDQLGYSPEDAPLFVSIGLTAGATASLFSQAVLVRQLRLSPSVLMRIAPAILIIGHSMIFAFPHLWSVVLGMTFAGLGAGLAVPGYNAAASLAVDPDEQGAAIGVVNSSGAAGFIISPALAGLLYAISPGVPYMATASLSVVLLFFAWRTKAIIAATHVVKPEAAALTPERATS